MKDLSMHIMDIAQNSIAAKATQLYIEINENSIRDLYCITIIDDGIGMPEKILNSVIDPFFTTRVTRKVGLDIPLLKQNAERTGGDFTIESEEGKGTKLVASFDSSHPDFLPLGDIAGTIVLLTAANKNISIKYRHISKKGEYLYDTQKVNETLDGVSIDEPAVIKFLKDMINENLTEIEVLK